MIASLFEQDENAVYPITSDDWYTPSKYADAARSVMGSIDLDPASCEMANRTVKATRYYTKADNGLLMPWHGNVWVNPPFAATDTCRLPQLTWYKKADIAYRQGEIRSAIMLMMVSKQRWFHALWDYPVCLSMYRIHFIRPGRKAQEIRDGNCFVYIGPDEQRFTDVFSQFGTVAKRIGTPPLQRLPRLPWEETRS